MSTGKLQLDRQSLPHQPNKVLRKEGGAAYNAGTGQKAQGREHRAEGPSTSSPVPTFLQ